MVWWCMNGGWRLLHMWKCLDSIIDERLKCVDQLLSSFTGLVETGASSLRSAQFTAITSTRLVKSYGWQTFNRNRKHFLCYVGESRLYTWPQINRIVSYWMFSNSKTSEFWKGNLKRCLWVYDPCCNCKGDVRGGLSSMKMSLILGSRENVTWFSGLSLAVYFALRQLTIALNAI